MTKLTSFTKYSRRENSCADEPNQSLIGKYLSYTDHGHEWPQEGVIQGWTVWIQKELILIDVYTDVC